MRSASPVRRGLSPDTRCRAFVRVCGPSFPTFSHAIVPHTLTGPFSAQNPPFERSARMARDGRGILMPHKWRHYATFGLSGPRGNPSRRGGGGPPSSARCIRTMTHLDPLTCTSHYYYTYNTMTYTRGVHRWHDACNTEGRGPPYPPSLVRPRGEGPSPVNRTVARFSSPRFPFISTTSPAVLVARFMTMA